MTTFAPFARLVWVKFSKSGTRRKKQICEPMAWIECGSRESETKTTTWWAKCACTSEPGAEARFGALGRVRVCGNRTNPDPGEVKPDA